MSTGYAVEVYKYHLQPGYIYTSTDATVVSAVVGSCVAVCLYDRRNQVGGMNHFLFPRTGRRDRTTAQFGNVAVPALIRMMIRQGSRIEDMEAQIYGGGHRPADHFPDVGRRNVKVARKILKRRGIPVVTEDVGGSKGRRIVYHTATNETIVMKTDKIRRGDWYPYRPRLSDA